MIVKILKWKKCTPGILLTYIADPDKEISEKNSVEIFQNVRQPNLSGAIYEMKQNDQWRKKRRGGNALYHEVLSFHEDDAKHLTAAMFEDIIRKYLAIRSPNAIAYAKIHWDKKNPHCHIAMHGCEYRSSKVLRMDNAKFEKVRRGSERYTLEHYPQLTNSVVYLNKPIRTKENAIEKDQNTRGQNEFQLKARTKDQLSKKDMLKATIQKCFQRASSTEEFHDLILQEGLELYQYRNKTAGVKLPNESKKFRWKTCGIEKVMFQELDNQELRDYNRKLKELEELSNDSAKKIDKGLNLDL